MDQPNQGVKAIFDRALEIDTPADRQAFLEAACAGESTLRDQVESLLRAYAEAGSFLEEPASVEVGAGQTRPSPPDLPPVEALPSVEGPGARLGPYQLVQKIGEGGMGTVWRAAQQAPVRREVALKVIKPGLGSEAIIARFEAERQALALMDHPHIARVLDAGATTAGRPYFVMELVPGVPITQFCDAHGFGVRQRLELFIPVCRAVQHAHQKGIIHRDLKPSNVLVGLYDRQPVPKVIDFGIAKATGTQLSEQTLRTTWGTVVGTLEYMAPEQAELNALDIDTRADLYSLGVLLYELLTGSTPRRGRLKDVGLLEVLRLIREQEPERPSARLSTAAPEVAAARGSEPARLARQVKGDLDWIVMKCLEQDRSRRYETANGLARDLERYLADEPVEAGPPRAGYRLRKLARRHKGPVLAAALVLLALLAGLAGTSWGLVRAVQARQAEADQRERAEAKEREAKRQKEIAQMARAFLLNVLHRANPAVQADARRKAGGSSGAPRDLTLQELLDQAAQELTPDRIEAQFPQQPEMQAEILKTMGETYWGIGAYDKAVTFLGRASDIYRQALGADHLDTLNSLNSLANAYWALGQLDKAVPLYEQTLAKLQEQLGPDHPDILSSMNNLANAYRDLGQYAKAVRLHEQALAKRRETLGPEHRLTLLSMNNLAMAYADAGDFPKALPLFEQALAKQTETLGPDDPETLQSMNNLAYAYHNTNQLAKALPLYEQALANYQATHGRDHPRTLQTMSNLAKAYQDDRRLDQAIPLFERALAGQTANLGPDHPYTLIVTNNLAKAYQLAGQLSKAIPLFEQALPRFKEKLGPDHAFTLICRENLAWAYQKNGDFVQAEQLLREALSIRQQKQPDDWKTFDTQVQLGASLFAQERYPEAESLLVQGYEGLKQREATIPGGAKKALTEALKHRVQLYDAWGQKDQADTWRQRQPDQARPKAP